MGTNSFALNLKLFLYFVNKIYLPLLLCYVLCGLLARQALTLKLSTV